MGVEGCMEVVRRGIAPLLAGISTVAALALSATPASAAPGDLDPGFGRGGRISVKEGIVNDSVFGRDGSLVVALSRFGQGTGRVARYGPDGRLDRAFGDDGYAQLGGTVEPLAIDVAPDGRIAVAGRSRRKLVVSRLLADGSPDLAFGGAGTVRAGDVYNVFDIAQDTAGGTLVTSTFNNVTTLRRFSADGTLDAAFGARGTLDLSDAGAQIELDGTQIVVAGSVRGPELPASDVLVLRLNSDGTPDASFGSGGSATLDLANEDQLFDVAVDSQSRVVLIDGARGDGPTTPTAARLTATGLLDTSFGVGGSTSTFTGDAFAAMYALTLTTDGADRLLVAGSKRAGPREDAALLRLLPDGSPDPAFGDGGLTSFIYGEPERVTSLPDGRVGITGGTQAFAVVAADGPPDADADGHVDEADPCPSRFARRGSGCPLFKPRLSIGLRADGLGGGIVSSFACRLSNQLNGFGLVKARRIQVRRREEGDDPVIGRARIGLSSSDRRWELTTEVEPGASYYAMLPPRSDPVEGKCLPARSRSIRIPNDRG